MNREEIERNLQYNVEFSQEFEEYLEGLPEATSTYIQRQLQEIRQLSQVLEERRSEHYQAGSEEDRRRIRNSMENINQSIQNEINNILSVVSTQLPPVREDDELLQRLRRVQANINTDQIISELQEHEDELQRRISVVPIGNPLRAGLNRHLINLTTERNNLIRSRPIQEESPILNIQEESNDQNMLQQQSYETLLKQLYNLPVAVPQFLIINGLKVDFLPFEQVSSIQIDRYIIEPLLQPWAAAPYSAANKILTIFDKNGMTYLVKARYDGNRIFPPI